MWAKRSFKAAQILITVILAVASTLTFVQSEGGRLIYARHFQTAPPKGVQAPPISMAQTQAPAPVIEKRAPPAVEKKFEFPPSGPFADHTVGDAVTTGTGRKTPNMTTGNAGGPSETTTGAATTGAATTGAATTGAATTGAATTGAATSGAAGQTVGSAKGSSGPSTGAAGPIPAATAGTVILAYDGRPADARLKLVLADLRSDLRKSIAEITRSPPKAALQSALDVLGRSQERTDLLVDIAPDVDFRSKGDPRRSGPADAPDNHATTGSVKAAAVLAGPAGMVPDKKDGSPWLEPAVLVSMVGILVALVIAWFGDNLSERIFGRRRGDFQLAGNVPAVLAAPDVRQIEQQPPSS